MKDGAASAIVKSIVLVILGAVIILGVYLVLTRNKKPAKDEDYVLTAVDEITTTSLDMNYPADPRMVVEFYAKIMRTLYRETYSEEQQDAMLEILAGIMDDELLDNQTNFYKSMKKEVAERKADNYGISVYVVQNTEPVVVKVGGKKMCEVECLFSIRKGKTYVVKYQFILRQDDEGRWKILGWTVKEDE